MLQKYAKLLILQPVPFYKQSETMAIIEESGFVHPRMRKHRNHGKKSIHSGRMTSWVQRHMDRKISRLVRRWVCEEAYLEYGLDLEETAAQIGVKADRLASFFHRHYGMSYLSWRVMMRIERAKQVLLDYPEIPLCRVGEMVGIPDKSNFRKLFIRHAGCSPQEWRRNGLSD